MNGFPLALALSITALPSTVNAQSRNLASVNNSQKKSVQNDFSQFAERLLKTGNDDKVGRNLAAVIGLPNAMPIKVRDIIISRDDRNIDTRSAFAVYTSTEHPAAIWIYLVRSKRSGRDKKGQYFKVDLTGRLEKSVLSQGKHDEAGKPIRGSGVKFDQDIDSPEVRKAFAEERDYWLNEWMKKAVKPIGPANSSREESAR